MKEFFLDVYEGIYFRARDKESVNMVYFTTFFSYHAALLMLLVGIRVVIYGPFKPFVPGILLLLFGVYGLIYWYFIRPYRNTGEIDENMDEALMEKKKRRSIYAQVGGLICVVTAFAIVYVLYEIFDPKSMAR